MNVKKLLFISSQKDKTSLLRLMPLCKQCKLQLQLCINENEFISHYSPQCIVVCENPQSPTILKIKKLLPTPIRLYHALTFSCKDVEKFKPAKTFNTNIDRIYYILNKIHFFPYNFYYVILIRCFEKMCLYGVESFKYSLINLVCHELKLDYSVEIAYIKDELAKWYKKEKNTIENTFPNLFNFEKLTIKNFANSIYLYNVD